MKSILEYVIIPDKRYLKELISSRLTLPTPEAIRTDSEFAEIQRKLINRSRENQRVIQFIDTFFDKKLRKTIIQLNAQLKADRKKQLPDNITWTELLPGLQQLAGKTNSEIEPEITTLLAEIKDYGITKDRVDIINKRISPRVLLPNERQNYQSIRKTLEGMSLMLPDNWNSYQNILQGADPHKVERNEITLINDIDEATTNLTNAYRLYRPYVTAYHEIIDKATYMGKSERNRKLCLAALNPVVLHSITFEIQSGKVATVIIRRKDKKNPKKMGSVYTVPDFCLTYFNILNVWYEKPDGTDGFLKQFNECDAEITFSNGALFNEATEFVEAALKKWDDCKNIVQGEKKSTYRDRLLKRLYYLKKWYKTEGIEKLSNRSFQELVEGLFNLDISESDFRIRIEPKGKDRKTLQIFSKFGI